MCSLLNKVSMFSIVISLCCCTPFLWFPFCRKYLFFFCCKHLFCSKHLSLSHSFMPLTIFLLSISQSQIIYFNIVLKIHLCSNTQLTTELLYTVAQCIKLHVPILGFLSKRNTTLVTGHFFCKNCAVREIFKACVSYFLKIHYTSDLIT